MIETLILSIGFLYLIITSILDIKYRLVWDYINFSFGAIFLIIRLFELILIKDLSIFIGMILITIVTFILGLILYKLGAWGGGDLKLLTALSIGIAFLPSDKLNILTLQFPFYVNFLINTLFSGILFGIIWSLFLIFKTKTYKKFNKAHEIIIFIGIITFFISIFLPMKEKLFMLMISVFSFYYVIKIFENIFSIINKPVKKLDEGDWILKDIKLKNKKIIKKPTGLSKEDIKILQKTKLKTIKIKDGIPFLVSFLLAYVITLIINNNLLNIIILKLLI